MICCLLQMRNNDLMCCYCPYSYHSSYLHQTHLKLPGAKGDFGISFSETWGTPYDPHSYVSAWEAEDNANYNALAGLTETGSSRTELLGMIEDVLQEEDNLVRTAKWNEVHQYYHDQAMMLPLWGRRVVAIVNNRLGGFQPGHQQFDFPVHKLVPLSPSVNGETTTVTIAPGALTGRFEVRLCI